MKPKDKSRAHTKKTSQKTPPKASKKITGGTTAAHANFLAGTRSTLLSHSFVTEIPWGEILRQVEFSVGGWACELLELRRTKRLVPTWCRDVSVAGFPDMDFA